MVPLSFISVCILRKFAMLLDVYTLPSPQEEEMHSSSGVNRFMYTSGNTFIKKIKLFVCNYISMPPENIKKDCKTSCLMICLPSVIDELEPFHQ